MASRELYIELAATLAAEKLKHAGTTVPVCSSLRGEPSCMTVHQILLLVKCARPFPSDSRHVILNHRCVCYVVLGKAV